MPSLLDQPTPDETLLLKTVAKCFYDAENHWPIWQYVERRYAEISDRDAIEVLRGMPTWRNGYRYVQVDHRGGVGPSDDAVVQLSAAGIYHSTNMWVLDLLAAMIQAVKIAARMQQEAEPSPLQPAHIVIKGMELTERAHKASGVSIPPLILSSMLSLEPIVRNGIIGLGGIEWVWRLENVRLGQFRKLGGGEDYLEIMETIVGIPPAAAEQAPLSPLSVPEALDTLDLAWRLATTERLLDLRSAVRPASLTQPVTSEDEFKSRCSAIAVILDSFSTRVPPNPATKIKGMKSLQGMKARLEELLPSRADRAVAAVDVLRNIAAVRDGQQHIEDADARRARVALGLATLTGDWPASWNLIQNAMVNALRTIREELPI